jgi:uncharacterized RDD family membrane protein YckC
MDKRVGFGPRLGAALIDFVVIVVLAVVFGGVVGGMLGLGAGAAIGSTSDSEGAAAAGAAAGALLGVLGGFAIGAAVFGVLYSLIEGLTGASPGKMILKLKVGTADGHAGQTSLYLTRWAVKNSGQILAFLSLILATSALGTLGTLANLVIFVGCFMVLGAKRQAIHDMVAKTAVFNKADLV